MGGCLAKTGSTTRRGRSSGVCRLPAARKAVPHRQGRHRAGWATRPGKRDGWDRSPSPQAEAGLCAWAAAALRPGGSPRPQARVASLMCRAGSSAAVCAWGWPPDLSRQRRGCQGAGVQGVGAGWHAESGARRAGGSKPRSPRRCPAPPGPGVWCACPVRRGLPQRGAVVRQSVVGEGGRGGASRRSSVPAPVPNKGVQATANSLRSYVAPAARRA